LTESKILLDSSAWIEYFYTGKEEIREIIESGEYFLLASAISILEVKRKLLKDKCHPNEIKATIEFIRNNSIIKDVTEEICDKAGEDCIKKKLHAADAIIYRTARENNAKIITLDSDFAGISSAVIL